ncbi:hypothetical protein J2X06_001234 [Lysobacter niastensis]|uniref:Uncharacterized protein n=1 Tax=Lysobacter niastensis TaxID=380629 RepID=A0ABU1W9Q6_9GAMM|nr:hypothetical protein [Lysobacter niastensis]MDR7134050.1 hypothetical protein [Lysobacter niastensis]
MGKYTAILWALLQVASGLAAFWVGRRIALWAMADPVAKAPAEALAILPAQCPAFRATHGTYFCEPLGVTSSQPVWLLAAIGVLVFSIALTIYLDASGRGLSSLSRKFNFPWHQGSRPGA